MFLHHITDTLLLDGYDEWYPRGLYISVQHHSPAGEQGMNLRRLMAWGQVNYY